MGEKLGEAGNNTEGSTLQHGKIRVALTLSMTDRKCCTIKKYGPVQDANTEAQTINTPQVGGVNPSAGYCRAVAYS